MSSGQRKLSDEQAQAFRHDYFVGSQVRAYLVLVPAVVAAPRAVVDIGGGVGSFAQALKEAANAHVRVLDADPACVRACEAKAVPATLGDAISPHIQGDEDVVCFNLILHHLVGDNERATRNLQLGALAAWRNQVRAVFVHESVYDSYLFGLSGRAIYFITGSAVLSLVARVVGKFVPSLKANTLGVGVRFRGQAEWIRIFSAAGYRVVRVVPGSEEGSPLTRRLLLIRSCRRDSFLLVPQGT